MTPRSRGMQVVPGDDVGPLVPRVLRVTAALGWRLLVVVAAVYVLGVVAGRLAAVVVPVAVAVLLAALLSPAVQALHRHGVPRAAAAALVLVGGLAALGGVLTFVIVTFVRGVPPWRPSSPRASTPSSVGCPPDRCS